MRLDAATPTLHRARSMATLEGVKRTRGITERKRRATAPMPKWPKAYSGDEGEGNGLSSADRATLWAAIAMDS